MSNVKCLLALILVLGLLTPCFADDATKIVGVWRIVSFEQEAKATGERIPLLGKEPKGYVIYTPEGLMMAVLTGGDERKNPSTDKDRAELFQTMFAYTGKYRVEGDKVTIKVEASWNPAWVGTEQVRLLKLEGDRLQMFTVWAPLANRPERGIGRGILTFERVK